MSQIRTIAVMTLFFAASQFTAPLVASAKEFKVNCSSLEDCMKKGDKLTKRRKLSLAQEAYRNAVKFDVNDKDAWRKFEILTIRISEEGGC
jgi:hypothetical protein